MSDIGSPPVPETQPAPQPIVRTRTEIAIPAAPFVIGKSGGMGGRYFDTGVFPDNAALRQIHIRYGDYINAIGVSYEMPDLTTHDLPIRGGKEGKLARCDLRRGEYVTRISGRYGKYVDSLVIHTNLRPPRRYGGSGGTVAFQYDTPPGFEVCGFGGKSGDNLHSIGPMLRRLPDWPVPGDDFIEGPVGDFHGTSFRDDPVSLTTRIVGVLISADERLYGIGLIALEGSRPVELGYYGADRSGTVLPLEDGEYIIGITGFYDEVVRGIRIVTNQRISEAHGAEVGVPFVFKTNPLDSPNAGNFEVVGLLGQHSDCINALGVRYRRRGILRL